MSSKVTKKLKHKISSLVWSHKNEEELKKIILNNDVISFDMFDTLVERMVFKPYDVFTIVEKKFDKLENKKSNFKNIRISAENISSSENDGITTLDSIYDHINNFNDKEKKLLKQLELEAEKNLIKIKNSGKKLYDFAKYNNKFCILTSDMYLPKEFLIKILNDMNLYFDDYYISCEVGVSKANSKIYDILKEKYSDKKIVHIGDNYYHDFINAMNTHLNTIFMVNTKKIPGKYSIEESLISSYRDHYCSNNELTNVGYKYFGPFMLGFSKFINRNAKGDILFLSRDGYFMKQVYDTLYKNNDSKYFYGSRKAFLIPSLYLDSSFYSLKDKFKWFNKVSWKQLLYRLNLDIKIPNVDINYIYTENEFFCQDNESIYNEFVKKKLELKACKQYELLHEYFEKSATNTNVTLVDIGWFGTMQQNMMNIFSSKQFNGLYLGCSSNLENTKGYMFDLKNKENKYSYKINAPLYELLFYAPHGSVKGYNKVGEDISFDLEEMSLYYQNNLDTLLKFQDAAIQFNYDICYFIDVLENIDEFAFEFIDYLYNPSRKFLKEIQNLYISDGEEHKLINVYKKVELLKLKKIRHSTGNFSFELKLNCLPIIYNAYKGLRFIKHKLLNK